MQLPVEPQPPALAGGPAALGAPEGPLRAGHVGVVWKPALRGGAPAARAAGGRPLRAGTGLERFRALLASRAQAWLLSRARELSLLGGGPGALSPGAWPLHAERAPGASLVAAGALGRPRPRAQVVGVHFTLAARQLALGVDRQGSKQTRLPAEAPPTSWTAEVPLSPRDAQGLLYLGLVAELIPSPVWRVLRVAPLVLL